jgi:hypothetical protein
VASEVRCLSLQADLVKKPFYPLGVQCRNRSARLQVKEKRCAKVSMMYDCLRKATNNLPAPPQLGVKQGPRRDGADIWNA